MGVGALLQPGFPCPVLGLFFWPGAVGLTLDSMPSSAELEAEAFAAQPGDGDALLVEAGSQQEGIAGAIGKADCRTRGR